MGEESLLYNGKIITETHLIENGYLIIKDGKIASLGVGGKNLKAKTKIDCKKNFVSPGFIDIHTHGIMDVDFMESPAEKLIDGLKEYVKYGVTGVIGTTLSNPYSNIINQLSEFRKVQEDRLYGKVLIGAHIEGPWLSPRCKGGHALKYLTYPDKRNVEKLLSEVGDVIKSVTYAPEVKNAIWLTEKLTYNGILGIIGHTEATYEQVEAVIRAGARHVTHMFDGILSYKENPDEALVMMPGLETSVFMHDEVSIELIGCPVHVPPPFFRLINKIKPTNKKILVTDSLVGTGMKDGTVLTYKDGRKVYVSNGVLRMIDDDPKISGNLTGSAVTMNLALKRLSSFAGLSISDAIKWCTVNPARLFGLDKNRGSIKVGKDADIVIIDDNFNVKMTIISGSIVYKANK